MKDYSAVNLEADFVFIGHTDEEKSLVCLQDDIPANTKAIDKGWLVFQIESVLYFSLIELLAKISALLADEQISVLHYLPIIQTMFW